MNTIQVEGVLYTKASLLAKKFHYTTDYIGQLCRAKKVDCQLVGRAWYVSESSLLQHKDARYKEVRTAEKTSSNNDVIVPVTEVISVSPRLKRVTAKQMTAPKSHFLNRLGASESKYFVDETELLPQPLRAQPRITPILPTIPERIVVSPAEAVPVRVSSSTKPAKLTFTPLPEVALQGHLVVEDVELAEEMGPVSTADIERVQTPHLVKPRPVPVPAVPAASGAPIPKLPRHLTSFTPRTVSVRTASPATRFLVPLALAASVTLFLFITVAFQSLVIVGTNLSASIMFSFDSLRELLSSSL